MPGEKRPHTLTIIVTVVNLIIMMVTLGSLLFANRAETMSRDEVLHEIEKGEQRTGQALGDVTARLARLEQMHGPGGHP